MEIIEIKEILRDKIGQKVQILYLDGQQALGRLRELKSQHYLGLPEKDYLWVILQDGDDEIHCYHLGIREIKIL